jgi:hypothetical protein
VARPSFSIWFIDSQAIQGTAGIGFESVHHQFGPNVRLDNRMDVIGSHVRRREAPAAVQTDFPERIEHVHAAYLIEEVRGLIHLAAFYGEARRIGVC